MARFSILLGSAPEDFRQKKIEDMFDFLSSKRNEGDSIVTFANGTSELMLEMALDSSLKQNPDGILPYICALRPVSEDEKSLWLGGEEIRRGVIEHYQKLAADCGVDFQVVLDWDSETVGEEELGWEKAGENWHADFPLSGK